MSKPSKPVIEIDLSKYMPSHFDLVRVFDIVENIEEKTATLNSKEEDLELEELEWLEQELEKIDKEQDTKNLHSQKYGNSTPASIYI